MSQISFLGYTSTPEKKKIRSFLSNITIPPTVKQVERLTCFTQCLRTFIPKLTAKLLPFYKLLRRDVKFRIEKGQLDNFETIQNDLLKAATTTLRLAKPNQNYVIIFDAIHHSISFVLMIGDYLEKPNDKETKTYAPASFGGSMNRNAKCHFVVRSFQLCILHWTLSHFSFWDADDQSFS